LGIFDPAHRRGGVFPCLNRSRAKTNGRAVDKEMDPTLGRVEAGCLALVVPGLSCSQKITNSVIAQEAGRHPSSYVKAAAAVCSRSRADPELRHQERATREDAATEAALLVLGTGVG